MIRINGKPIPETKTLGRYTLKEFITPQGTLCVDIYFGDEFIWGFSDCSIKDFNSEEELIQELNDVEEEIEAENEAEGRMARSGW